MNRLLSWLKERIKPGWNARRPTPGLEISSDLGSLFRSRGADPEPCKQGPGHYAQPEAESLRQSFEQEKCPDCGGNKFLNGPKAGMCQNVECDVCGSDFNLVMSMIDGEIIFVERIGWNNSGRWEDRGKLKA